MDSNARIQQLYQEILAYRFSDASRVLSLCDELSSLAELTENTHAQAYSLHYICDAYITLGQLDKALQYGTKAIQYMITYSEDTLLVSIYNLIAIIFIYRHDDLSALSYYIKALDYAEKTDNKKMLGIIYSNIGSIFNAYDSEYGLEYLLKGETYVQDIISPNGQATCQDESVLYNYEVEITNIADAYIHIGKYQDALDKITSYLALQKNQLPRYIHIPFFYIQIIAYSKLGLVYDMKNAAHRFVSYLSPTEFSSEDFKPTFLIAKEMIQSGLFKEALKVIECIAALPDIEKDATNSCMISELYILYYQKKSNNDALLTHYRKFFKYHAQKNSNLQNDYIKAINNKIELEKELEISKYYEEDAATLEKMSESDSLTGLANRYGLNKYYSNNFTECIRKNEVFGLMIIDIDHFKTYNDSQGHLAGDASLKYVADIIKESTTEKYYCARYGGDEFFVVCRDIPYLEFQITAATIVNSVRELNIGFSNSKTGHVTVSIGAVLAVPSATQTITDFISCADAALYRVKKASRDNYYIKTDITAE